MIVNSYLREGLRLDLDLYPFNPLRGTQGLDDNPPAIPGVPQHLCLFSYAAPPGDRPSYDTGSLERSKGGQSWRFRRVSECASASPTLQLWCSSGYLVLPRHRDPCRFHRRSLLVIPSCLIVWPSQYPVLFFICILVAVKVKHDTLRWVAYLVKTVYNILFI